MGKAKLGISGYSSGQAEKAPPPARCTTYHAVRTQRLRQLLDHAETRACFPFSWTVLPDELLRPIRITIGSRFGCDRCKCNWIGKTTKTHLRTMAGRSMPKESSLAKVHDARLTLGRRQDEWAAVRQREVANAEAEQARRSGSRHAARSTQSRITGKEGDVLKAGEHKRASPRKSGRTSRPRSKSRSQVNGHRGQHHKVAESGGQRGSSTHKMSHLLLNNSRLSGENADLAAELHRAKAEIRALR